MFNLSKRHKQQPEEPAPDYYNWDHESLLSVFPVCTHHPDQRSVVVKVPHAPVGQQRPEPLCAGCDITDRQ
jgi:hypothetical protein